MAASSADISRICMVFSLLFIGSIICKSAQSKKDGGKLVVLLSDNTGPFWTATISGIGLEDIRDLLSGKAIARAADPSSDVQVPGGIRGRIQFEKFEPHEAVPAPKIQGLTTARFDSKSSLPSQELINFNAQLPSQELIDFNAQSLDRRYEQGVRRQRAQASVVEHYDALSNDNRISSKGFRATETRAPSKEAIAMSAAKFSKIDASSSSSSTSPSSASSFPASSTSSPKSSFSSSTKDLLSKDKFKLSDEPSTKLTTQLSTKLNIPEEIEGLRPPPPPPSRLGEFGQKESFVKQDTDATSEARNNIPEEFRERAMPLVAEATDSAAYETIQTLSEDRVAEELARLKRIHQKLPLKAKKESLSSQELDPEGLSPIIPEKFVPSDAIIDDYGNYDTDEGSAQYATADDSNYPSSQEFPVEAEESWPENTKQRYQDLDKNSNNSNNNNNSEHKHRVHHRHRVHRVIKRIPGEIAHFPRKIIPIKHVHPAPVIKYYPVAVTKHNKILHRSARKKLIPVKIVKPLIVHIPKPYSIHIRKP